LAADDKESQLRIRIAMQPIRERMQVTQTTELDSLQAISLKKAITAADELYGTLFRAMLASDQSFLQFCRGREPCSSSGLPHLWACCCAAAHQQEPNYLKETCNGFPR
jgi:hypothetical protein